MDKCTKINLKQLSKEIKSIKRWHPLYKVLKRELSILGYWKLLKRGNPNKAYKYGLGKHAKKNY
jgi:vacuolar-type H+-ATPase subunit D/Vma8